MTEMSSMSEMSQSTGAQEPPQDGDDKFTKIGIMVILLLLVLVGVAYFSRSVAPEPSGGGGSGGGGEGEDEEKNGGGGGGFVLNPPVQPPPPTTRFVRKRTRGDVTTSPTPDQFAEPKSTPRLIPKKLDNPHVDVIFCTVSYRALFESQMPPDGVCDFLAYKEVWVEYWEVRSQYDQESLETFKKHAKAAQKTRHGASFSYRYAAHSENVMTKSSSSLIKPLWESNVQDFGILLAYENLNTLWNPSTSNLSLLKLLRTHQKKLAGSGTPHTFLGIINRDFDRYSDKTLSMLKNVSTTYPITILILITHFFIYDASSEPRPPGIWISSVKTPADVSVLGTKFSSHGINRDILFLTSYTMAVCKYAMSANWGGGTSGSVESFSPVRYSETCYQKSNINRNRDDYVYIAADKAKRVLLMFDTAETIIYKTSKFYALYAHPKHGVALYDVDYDDNTNACGMDTFHRVREIKRYLHL